MTNAIIIKIESGVVAGVYPTGPVQVIVVDHDMIEGGETFMRKYQKAVLSVEPEPCVKTEEIDAVVMSLLLECVRPADRRTTTDGTHKEAA